MARGKNQLKTIQVTIATTLPMVKHLQALVETGFYGKHYTEAAERLLSRTLEEMVGQGKFKSRSQSRRK